MTDQQSVQRYFPGVSLDLRVLSTSGNAPDSIIQVHVKSLFLPVTKAQAMCITLPSDLGPEFPANAVLKLYDPRWIDDRCDRLWSPSLEAAARAAWREKKWNGMDLLYDDDDTVEGYDDAQWEEYYRQLAQARFATEGEVYRRLSDMQGSIIPRCYASVQVVPPPTDREVPEEALVYGLMLEEVGGADHDDFDPSVADYTSLGHSLMAAVYTFPSCGLMHHDVRWHNILISPNRIAIIDFGEAILRKEGVSDDEWNEQVRAEDEVEALRILLNDEHIRDRTPYDSRYTGTESSIRRSRRSLKMKIGRQSEEWKRRWYNRVPEAESNHPEESEWFIKEDVAIWLDSRPPPPQRFLVPRPGSPGSLAPSV